MQTVSLLPADINQAGHFTEELLLAVVVHNNLPPWWDATGGANRDI